MLSGPLSSGTLDLSGIPLTARDMERLCAYLQRHASTVVSLELGFTELTDEAFLLLLPTLAALPHLETLALNGNRLTRTILKELTDALKVRNSNVFELKVFSYNQDHNLRLKVFKAGIEDVSSHVCVFIPRIQAAFQA